MGLSSPFPEKGCRWLVAVNKDYCCFCLPMEWRCACELGSMVLTGTCWFSSSFASTTIAAPRVWRGLLHVGPEKKKKCNCCSCLFFFSSFFIFLRTRFCKGRRVRWLAVSWWFSHRWWMGIAAGRQLKAVVDSRHPFLADFYTTLISAGFGPRKTFVL